MSCLLLLNGSGIESYYDTQQMQLLPRRAIGETKVGSGLKSKWAECFASVLSKFNFSPWKIFMKHEVM